MLLAHSGTALQPHDVLGAWNLDPLLLAGLAAAALCYRRGWRHATDGRLRAAAFGVALVTIAVAVISPIDAVSGVLASAHMVQHVLLLVVAAPLLAVSAPSAALLRGTPQVVRSGVPSARRLLGIDAAVIRRTRSPVPRWIAYVVILWLWHASFFYGLAVEHEVVHAVEHLTFLFAALLVWSSVLGPARSRMSKGLGIVFVFTLGLQTIFLSALLTFATSPWYEPYLDTTAEWGLTPLADQQLAGVIMWVPAGIVHVGIALWLLSSWLREIDGSTTAYATPQPESTHT